MEFVLDETAARAAFSQPDNDGAFNGKLGDYLHILSARRPVILFAFPPKAAGTFLRTAAVIATCGQLRRINHAQGGRDTQPYLPFFIAYYLGMFGELPLVAHAHMLALGANRHFIHTLDLKPIAMLRAIPDMLASYWDMLEVDPDARASGLNNHIPERFPAMTRGQKADFLVDMLGPWYASYYAGWLEFAKAEPERVLFLQYTDFLEAPGAVLASALSHAGTPRSDAVCEGAVRATWQERALHRFNRGELHRGARYFERRHFDALARMLSYYSIPPAYQEELLG